MNIERSIDLVEILIDEIALEGLDGITLEGTLIFIYILTSTVFFSFLHVWKSF